MEYIPIFVVYFKEGGSAEEQRGREIVGLERGR